MDLEMGHGFCFAGRSRTIWRPLPRGLRSILSKTLAYGATHGHRGDLAGAGPTSVDELWVFTWVLCEERQVEFKKQ